MNPITFHRPLTLRDASDLFAQLDNATFMSGGHTLLPSMKQGFTAPDHLIDLSQVPDNAQISFESGYLTIGAMARHVEVATSAIVQNAIPALAGLAGSIGDRQVRQRGTIGGSVANNDPAADYPSGVLGLGATVITTLREILADDFFVSLFETALQPGEIITAVRFPVPKSAGYAKFKSPAARYPQAGVFIATFEQAIRVAVTGAGASGVFRLTQLEQLLKNQFNVAAAQSLEINTEELLSDLYATQDYRANLIKIMAERAIAHMGQASVFK